MHRLTRLLATFLLLCFFPLVSAVLPDSASLAGNSATAPVEAAPDRPSTDSTNIPAVIDRPFDAEEGPYIYVEGFRLFGDEGFSGLDKYTSVVQTSILEKIRKEQPERGFSIGELQEVADKVTRYYRSKGLILLTAVIPVQTVKNGIVDIQIFVGRLGRLLVEGNKNYNENILKKPFRKLMGQPVTQQSIEAALLTLTNFPGLSAFGVFQPGEKVGDADLILKVQEEKWYDVALRLDNHGLRETGKNRFRTTISWNNPTGFADKVTATYQQAYNPNNSNYWGVEYERYLGNAFTLGLGTFRNTFNVAGSFSENRISADSRHNVLSLEKFLIRGRKENLSTKLSLARKKSVIESSDLQVSVDRLTVLSLSLSYDSADTFHPFRPLINLLKKESNNFGGGLNFATLAYSRGFNNILGAMGSSNSQLFGATDKRSMRRGNSPEEWAEGQFDKITASYQRLQLMAKNQSLLFRTELQWSGDILTSLEQYSIGGPQNVRGYPDARGLFDRAYFLSLEYMINAPFFADKQAFDNRSWGELLQFSVFYDFAVAQQNDFLDTNADNATVTAGWNRFESAGIGLRFNIPGKIDSRLMYAARLVSTVSEDDSSGYVWWDFTYNF